MVTEQEIRRVLGEVMDPGLKKSLLELGMVKDIRIEKDQVRLTLALTTLRCPMKKKIVEDVKRAVESLSGVSGVEVELTAMSKEERTRLVPKHPLMGIQKVKNFIAVASGKGGVGKTTVAINVAVALSKNHLQVGLLDADVYGPSIPIMLGLSQKPHSEAGMIVPLEKFGLKIMSFGFFVDERKALIWRGPLVAKTIQQLLNEVMWGELDYLVVDLPPGTGDPSITIAQAIPGCHVIIVTTPQDVALADVRKAISMFTNMNVQIHGIVENMSYFRCAHSNERIEIFGKGGGEKLSRELNVPFLGSIPIDIELRKGGDAGKPLMVEFPESETGKTFAKIAQSIQP